MPLQSSLAVIMGIVKPKACPECGGSGVRAAPRTLEDLNEQLDALSDAEKEDFVKMLRQLEARGKA
jgi:hypothetical protein